MGDKYSHLSIWERQRLYEWYHNQGKSIREIGRLLGRSHSTISRELKRNISQKYVPTWYPHPAQRQYKIRIRDRGKRFLLKTPETREYVLEKLKLGWTPEIISGRLKLEKGLESVCHESIYQYIYKEANELIPLLPRSHKKRKKKYPTRKCKKRIEGKVSILDRPERINNRSEPGHWESDSLVSPQHKPGCNVLVERITRLVHISKLSSKESNQTKKAISNQLGQHKTAFVKSITYDNGVENSKHLDINKALGCNSYFCQAYHSWEKGAVEQVNSLIRRFLPKKTDITKVSNGRIKEIEFLLNNRPRKVLGYKTPLELYDEFTGALTP
jgi:IS30 family transposase